MAKSELYKENQKTIEEKKISKPNDMVGIDITEKKIRLLNEYKYEDIIDEEELRNEILNKSPIERRYLKKLIENKEVDFVLKYNSFLYIINRDIYISLYTKIDDSKFYCLMSPYINKFKYDKNKKLETNFDIYKAIYYKLKYVIKNNYNAILNLNKTNDIETYMTNKKLTINYYDFYSIFYTYIINTKTIDNKDKQFFRDINKQFICLYDYVEREEFHYNFVKNIEKILNRELNVKVINYNNISIKNQIIDYYEKLKYKDTSIKNLQNISGGGILFDINNNIIITQRLCKDFLTYKLNKLKNINDNEKFILEYLENYYTGFRYIRNDNNLTMMTVYNFTIINSYNEGNYHLLSLQYLQWFNNFRNKSYRFNSRLCQQNLFQLNLSKSIINLNFKYEESLHFSNWSIVNYYKTDNGYERIKYDIYKKRYNMIIPYDNNENIDYKYYMKIGNFNNKNIFYNNNTENIKFIKKKNNKYIIVKYHNSCFNLNFFIGRSSDWYRINKKLLVCKTDNFIIFNIMYDKVRSFQGNRIDAEFILLIMKDKFEYIKSTIEETIISWNLNNKISRIDFMIPGKLQNPYTILLYNYRRDKYLDIKSNLLSGYYGYNDVHSIRYDLNTFPVNICSNINLSNYKYNDINKIKFDYNNEFNIITKLKQLSLIPKDTDFYIQLDIQKKSKYYLAYALHNYRQLDYYYYILLHNFKCLSNDYYNHSLYKYKYYKFYTHYVPKFNERIRKYASICKNTNDIRYISEKESNIFNNNMAIINLIYFKGINNKILDNLVPEDAFDLYKIEFDIIYKECNIMKYDHYKELLYQKWNENISIREEFNYFYKKYELYYKFIMNYYNDKQNYIKLNIIDYIEHYSYPTEIKKNILSEIEKFNNIDFEYLSYNVNDLYKNKIYNNNDTSSIHYNLIINIKNILKSKKYKKMYNCLFGSVPKHKFKSLYEYFFYKNLYNYNINNYKDIVNFLKNNKDLDTIKNIYGSYQSHLIKYKYLKYNYKLNLSSKYMDYFQNLNINRKCDILKFNINGYNFVFDKPHKPRLSLTLFAMAYLKEFNLANYDNDEEKFNILIELLNNYKVYINDYKALEKKGFDIYIKHLNSFEHYGYYCFPYDENSN